MPLTVADSGSGEVKIMINGRFDFTLHQEFRASYADRPKGQGQYVIDMSGAGYMDSSALGMLLQLRDHAGSNKEAVAITRCSPEILEIFRISNFNKLFQLS